MLSSSAPGPDLPGDPGIARAIVKFLTKSNFVLTNSLLYGIIIRGQQFFEHMFGLLIIY